MTLYRKKSIEVEAVQWFKPGDHPAVKAQEAAGGGRGFDTGYGQIDHVTGHYLVIPGDWIITGVNGEAYVLKPDVFEASYEEVS